MTDLDKLERVIRERTPGLWEFRATEHSGGIKFVVASQAPRNENGTEFIPADCSHGFNGRFIALMGTVADELLAVVKAADEAVNEAAAYASNPNTSGILLTRETERLHYSLERLKKKLKEKLE